MSCSRVLLAILLPPLAVLDKGCGSIVLVSILTLFGWIPGIIAALVITSQDSRTVILLQPNTNPESNNNGEKVSSFLKFFPNSKRISNLIIFGVLVLICICIGFTRTILTDSKSPTETFIPEITAAKDTPKPTLIVAPTITPKASCSKLRFAEHLGPDDVDDMLHEGVSFKNVSEIAVRFDCQSVNIKQITWEWERNGELHCTNTFQSDECDQSTIIGWDRESDKFLITLFSKGGYLENLQSGRYDLTIYVSGITVLNGSIEISN